MVDGRRLAEVRSLLDLKYHRRKEAFALLAKQEARLRASIRQLDEQVRTADAEGLEAMKSIGADVIWKAWVGRTKTILNTELAQVLSQKEVLLRDVRKEFGKLEVAKALVHNEQEKEQKKRSQKALGQAIDTSVFK